MASTFFGLNTSYTGLLASNAALNTTANNIANVHTEGYSRQQVVQQAANAIRVFQTYGCAGAGVDTLAIERVRDEFYDNKFWENNSQTGAYSMKEYYMTQVENYFDDNGKNAGFKTIFDNMMTTGLGELLKNPDDISTKAQFVGTAGELTEYFNGLAGNMEKLQKDINQEIKLKVDEINSLAGEIATLNVQINTIELSGQNANELRDRRTTLLDELSEIVNVEVIEHEIQDTNNPDRDTGATRLIVKIGGGQVLVDASETNELECVSRASYEKINQTDIDGLYEIQWTNGERFNIYNASLSGSLAGLIQMRDGNNGENFIGQVTHVGTVNNGANDTVTIQVDRQYLKDLNKCNLSDQGGIIDLGNQEFYYDSWSYTKSTDAAGNEVHSYTFVLSDGTRNGNRLTNDRLGKVATIGSSVAYQGVPYYMNQMNEWVRTFSQKVNDLLMSGYDSNNDPGSMLFTGDWSTENEQYDFPAGTRYDLQGNVTVSNGDDSYYRLTAKNFSVLAAMELDASLLANRYIQGDGVESSDLLQDFQSLATDKDMMTFRGCSSSEFLQCILSDVALNTSRAKMFRQSFQDIGATIENQRISISGVDEDEEAINLVKYQNGYNLASKMISTLTEVYDRLILETGV
ncbi:MAG: flagellar hook-associated protein FlgK [Lachnospiraceae bacterium]|nr:flagellar hook-associated protein FlgK [Lachnospiraceae bacterium]